MKCQFVVATIPDLVMQLPADSLVGHSLALVPKGPFDAVPSAIA